MRVCRICGQAYPATSEYFYKAGKYLRALCKKCYIKRVKVPNRCKTCQRFNKKIGECMVMIELINDCWAWTNDKDWLKKVNQAVDEYKKMHGGLYFIYTAMLEL